jgi:hypothetical protein
VSNQLIDVDARAVEVLPRSVDQLVATRGLLAGLHRRGHAAVIPGVLELREVERLAVLEDVEFASDEIGRDSVRDDPAEHVLGVARLPVRPVVGLVAVSEHVQLRRGVVTRQAVGVVGLDAREVCKQLWI